MVFTFWTGQRYFADEYTTPLRRNYGISTWEGIVEIAHLPTRRDGIWEKRFRDGPHWRRPKSLNRTTLIPFVGRMQEIFLRLWNKGLPGANFADHRPSFSGDEISEGTDIQGTGLGLDMIIMANEATVSCLVSHVATGAVSLGDWLKIAYKRRFSRLAATSKTDADLLILATCPKSIEIGNGRCGGRQVSRRRVTGFRRFGGRNGSRGDLLLFR